MKRASAFFDAVFVINLKRRPDRWQAITSECQRAGLSSFERVDAYDGTRFSLDSAVAAGLLSPIGHERMTSLPEAQRIWGMDMSPGAVGCALSHADIWCQTAERRLERALVLEDDCLLPPSSFADTVERAVWPHVPQDWGYVFLSGLDTEQQCPHLRVARCGAASAQPQRYVCRVPRLYRTTNCYVVNHRGARQLLDACVPFTFQLDTAMTTMMVDAELNKRLEHHPSAPKRELIPPSSSNARDVEMTTAMTTEYASRVPCYCVDPPLAAQATRHGTDIQWNAEQRSPQSYEDEERSRKAAAGFS